MSTTKVVSLRGLRLQPVDDRKALECCVALSQQLYFTSHTLVVVDSQHYYLTVGSLTICREEDLRRGKYERDAAVLPVDIELIVAECGFRILNTRGKLWSVTSLGSAVTPEDFLEKHC